MFPLDCYVGLGPRQWYSSGFKTGILDCEEPGGLRGGWGWDHSTWPHGKALTDICASVPEALLLPLLLCGCSSPCLLQ